MKGSIIKSKKTRKRCLRYCLICIKGECVMLSIGLILPRNKHLCAYEKKSK